jgi:hypothetical protein
LPTLIPARRRRLTDLDGDSAEVGGILIPMNQRSRSAPKHHDAADAWLLVVRLVIGGLGIAALLVGLRAAWKSDSPTAALIVGGILIVVALVANRELAELSARWKDAGFTYKRATSGALYEVGDQLSELASASRSSDTEGAAEAQLEKLRGGVEELASVVKHGADEIWRGNPDSWAYLVTRRIREGSVELRDKRPMPDYRYNPAQEGVAHGPEIGVSLRWWGDWLIYCRVTEPGGVVTSQLCYGSLHMQGNNFSLHYPRTFERAPDYLLAGDYEFAWIRAVPTQAAIDDPQEWVEGPLLARDVVTVTSEMLDSGESRLFEVRREDVEDEFSQRVALEARLSAERLAAFERENEPT